MIFRGCQNSLLSVLSSYSHPIMSFSPFHGTLSIFLSHSLSLSHSLTHSLARSRTLSLGVVYCHQHSWPTLENSLSFSLGIEKLSWKLTSKTPTKVSPSKAFFPQLKTWWSIFFQSTLFSADLVPGWRFFFSFETKL